MSRRHLSSISWFHKNNRSRRHQTEFSLLRNPSKILESFLTRAVVMLLLFALEKSTISLSTFWVFTPDTCVVSLTHSFNCRVRRIASLALVCMVCIQVCMVHEIVSSRPTACGTWDLKGWMNIQGIISRVLCGLLHSCMQIAFHL